MKKTLLAACLSTTLSAAAIADDSGFRIGVGYSITKGKNARSSSSYGTGVKWDLGYDINRFISLAASYEKNGGDTDHVRTASVLPEIPETTVNYYRIDGKAIKAGIELGYGFQFNSKVQKGYVRPYLSAGYLHYEENGKDWLGDYDTDTFYYGLGIHFQGDSGAYIDVSYDFAKLKDRHVILPDVDDPNLNLNQGSVTLGYRF